jgi:uncharacterized RDD family membrane protein YckC
MKKNVHRPGLIVRLFIIIYDLLLLGGVLFASYAGIFAIFLLFPESISKTELAKNFQFALLILIAYFFYGWFWVNGGQTLGMKAWHLYLVDDAGKFLTWRMASIRFFTTIISIACLGMGFAWILVSRKNLTWHDIASKSQIIKQKPIKKNKGKQA